MTSRPENQAPRAPHLALVPRSRKPVARILPFPAVRAIRAGTGRIPARHPPRRPTPSQRPLPPAA